MRYLEGPVIRARFGRKPVWRPRALGPLILACFCATASFGQTVFFDFNTTGQYTNNFNPWNDNGGVNGGNYAYAESTNAGTGGSGGVSVFQTTDTTAIYKNGSWNFSTNGAIITLSTLIKDNGTTGGRIQFGILNTNNNGLNGNAGVAFESYRFVPSSATAWSLHQQFKSASSNAVDTTIGTVNVTSGHWYKFVINLTNTSGGTYNSACDLVDYGTDGQTPGASVVTFSTLQTHATVQGIASSATVWPGLRVTSGNIGAWDNFLVFTPASKPVITLPLTNVTVASGTPASFKVLADGPGTISYSWFTNSVLVSGANSSTYTTPPVGTGFTNITVVASNGNGSTTNSAAVNVIVASPPQVASAPAANITAASATLGGQILSTGGVPTTAILYYGTTDGGTNAGAWTQKLSLGTQTGAFAQTVTLTANTTYFFTVEASNAVGVAWATPSLSFTTLNGMTPIVLTGFNRDLVIENNAAGPPYTSAAAEFNPGEGTAFYQSGLPGTSFGLPASGAFQSAIDGSTIFQFQPYTGNNALVMSSETGISSGTLTLTTPAVYSSIAILANSGNGTPTSTGTLTLNFTDATTFTTNYIASDWFFNPGFALQGVDRIDISSGSTSGGPTDPRFYQTTLNLGTLLGAANKPIASMTFGQAPDANVSAVYAVSGLAAQTGPVTLAVVTNAPASNIQATTVTLNGQVLNTGNFAPIITIYYGTTDGGTNAGAWANSVSLGTQTGSFAQAISGLTMNTTYFFTAKAVNSAGTSWATPSFSFTTLAPTPATVANAPATGILGTGATLNGQVTSTGGDAPSITFFYGTSDGGTNPAAWAQNIALAACNRGSFSQGVSGLTTNTTYHFTARAVNSGGTSWAAPSQAFTTLAANPTLVSVLTYHNDNTRQGANTNETVLTLANVNTNTFGRLFTYTVDGYIYAEPLILPNVSIPGKGTHNVAYVVTEHDTVYAFDADSNAGANSVPLWTNSFLSPGVTTMPSGDTGSSDITPEVGITSTPVIDPVAGTIYVEVKTKESGAVDVHRLHALDVTTGLERSNSPVIIAATNYPGTGSGGSDTDGTHVLWNPQKELNRPALTLLNGVIYIAYASHGDNTPYHGWLFGYDAHTLAQLGVYNATPNGGLGGFWQGGGGATVDAQGNFYLQTGNGTIDTGNTNVTTINNYAMSVMKFTPSNGLPVLVDYFAPSNAVNLSGGDQDLGSSAPMILPDSAGSAAHPHLIVGGGKTAPIYLIDRDSMGRFNSGFNNIVQQFNGGPGGDRDTSPAFFNNTLYTIDSNSRIGAYTITNAQFNTTPVESPDTYANKGGATASISANGKSNAITWAIFNAGGETPTTPCILRAYNATNLTQKLYSSDQIASRDSAGNAVKFIVPTIANGKVYVGAQFALTVYGLASVFIATPVISPNGGLYTNSVMVTLSDVTAGTTIYYTLDGTTPTTNSILYTVPFALTNSVAVSAAAFKAGSAPSGVATASFINSSSLGSGTGLLGQYWSNVTSAAFTNASFNTPQTLTRVDTNINFNWGAGSPDPNISTDTFTVRWTGTVQPQFNETYTFSTTTEDGARLWVNNQLLVDKWVDQGPTTWSGSIALKAQQKYNIRMDYYNDIGNAQAMLAWSSPSTPQAIIPESQLSPTSNHPPVVSITSPVNGSNFNGTASITVTANAADPDPGDSVSEVDFYSNGVLQGIVTNTPYTLTTTGLGVGSYTLTAVALDGAGDAGTSAPVTVTVSAGSGQPYGLTSRTIMQPFFNMPTSFNGLAFGPVPATLSATGAFTNTPAMTPVAALVPYVPNTPLWSDGAVKSRWMGVPNAGAPYTPNEQIAFAPTGEWSFPSGTVFVKHFGLVTDLTNPNGPVHRLETRLLVRDVNGAVYGVTYKWRADNSDADLLTNSLSENITITNADSSTSVQTWYYPSPGRLPDVPYARGQLRAGSQDAAAQWKRNLPLHGPDRQSIADVEPARHAQSGDQ